MSKTKQAAEGFIKFVNSCPSPFHSVATTVKRLEKEGFMKIQEKNKWDLKKGGKYYFTRNHSTVFAFAVGEKYETGNGFNIIGAHTDSPCLKVKPVSNINSNGYLELGVQCYGGGLWYTWFDRDLAIGGRVIVKKNEKSYEHSLVFINKAVCRVPTLAIHLDRHVNNDGFKPNKETNLLPVLATQAKAQLEGKENKEEKANHHPILIEALANELKCKPEQIKDFELCLCDAVPATIGGLKEEFLYSPRLDNLMSCYCALEAFVNSQESLKDEQNIRLIAFFDNEEVGSSSSYGAASNMMEKTLTRIASSVANGNITQEQLATAFRKSFLISSDMAHAVHPNYASKHENNHKPALHKGPVIKVNANQRYATTAVTSFLLKEIANEHKIPIQEFVVRNDMGCGSTIGPILASNTGVRTIDIGNPQLSMHSIREMCGVDDVYHSIQLFQHFFNDFTKLDSKLEID